MRKNLLSLQKRHFRDFGDASFPLILIYVSCKIHHFCSFSCKTRQKLENSHPCGKSQTFLSLFPGFTLDTKISKVQNPIFDPLKTGKLGILAAVFYWFWFKKWWQVFTRIQNWKFLIYVSCKIHHFCSFSCKTRQKLENSHPCGKSQTFLSLFPGFTLDTKISKVQNPIFDPLKTGKLGILAAVFYWFWFKKWWQVFTRIQNWIRG